MYTLLWIAAKKSSKATTLSNLNIYIYIFLSRRFFKINLFIHLFIYFWLCWVFVAHGLSLVVASGDYSWCGARASHCGGFSCCGARALGTWASVVVARGLSSCGSRALERRLISCGPWA